MIEKIIINSPNAKETKITDRLHPLNAEKMDWWEFLWLSYRGGKEYLEKNYLWPHEFEKQELFKQRKSRAFYTNYCKPIVNTYANHLFKQPIRRDNIPEQANFVNDITGNGTKADTFFKTLATYAYIFGFSYVFIDMPVQRQVNSNSRIADREMRPVARVLKPTDVVDYSVSEGQFNWVLIKQSFYLDNDPFIERAEVDVYKLWQRDTWRIFDEEENVIASGINPLGFIPIFAFAHSDFINLSETSSLIDDIAKINNAIFNYSSLIDEMFYRNTFSQLVVQGPAEFYDSQIMGLSYAFNYPEGVNPPQFIAPPSGPAELIENRINTLILEIYRIAQLRLRGRGDKGAYKSIFELSQDYQDSSTSLSVSARRLEQLEKWVWMTMAQWMRMNIDPDSIEITYPAEFDVASIEADLESALEIGKIGMSRQLREHVMRRILSKKYPDLTEQQIDELAANPEMVITNNGLEPFESQANTEPAQT